MGDRTTCTLYLSGFLLGQHELELLTQALVDANVAEGRASVVVQDNTLCDSFTFWEVNYAELNSDLQETLQSLALAYVWSWNSGDDYPEGCIVSDVTQDFYAEENTCDGSFFLRLEEVDDPERLAFLRKARDMQDTILRSKLTVVDSAHALAAVFVDEPETLARWQQARADNTLDA